MKRSGSVAKALVQDPTGPGFESQVPILFCIIFLQIIQCLSKCVAYHASSCNQWTDGPQAKSDGPDGMPTICHGQRAYVESREVKAGLHKWALKLLVSPLIRPTPPLVISFSFFSFYLFISFINYFYYH